MPWNIIITVTINVSYNMIIWLYQKNPEKKKKIMKVFKSRYGICLMWIDTRITIILENMYTYLSKYEQEIVNR